MLVTCLCACKCLSVHGHRCIGLRDNTYRSTARTPYVPSVPMSGVAQRARSTTPYTVSYKVIFSISFLYLPARCNAGSCSALSGQGDKKMASPRRTSPRGPSSQFFPVCLGALSCRAAMVLAYIVMCSTVVPVLKYNQSIRHDTV